MLRPSSLSPSVTARKASTSCCSTSPPMASTRLRTSSSSSLNFWEMWCVRFSLSIYVTRVDNDARGQSQYTPGGWPHDEYSGAARLPCYTFGGKVAGEKTALAQLAVDEQLRPVALQDMFDDGEAETGAAAVAATGPVHPVKPFGEARQVLAGNADA